MIATRPTPPHDEDTRQRLRRVAAELFAQKGYSHTSIREICQLASVNGAAIHYHFGDKASLYRDIASPAAHLIDVPASLFNSDTGLREGIEAFYRPLTRTLTDDSLSLSVRLIWMREQIQPTHLLQAECSDLFRPRHEQLCRFLARHCGTAKIDDAINHLALSLAGMAMILYLKQDVVQAFAPALLGDSQAMETTLQRLINQAVTLVNAEVSRRYNEEFSPT